MKHTKGEWYTSGKSINNAEQHLVISEDKGQNVAVCYGVEEAQANAHLIAAAPELLEACKTAIEGNRTHAPIDVTFRILQEAINKAEGKN